MRNFILGLALGLLLIPAGVFLAGWLGFLPSTANVQPPAWEVSFGQMALKSYVERHAPHVTNPLPQTDDTVMAGYKVFEDACSGCHDTGFGATFYPYAPQFATAHPDLPDWQLFYIMKTGVRYTGMAAWDRSWHGDAAISDDRMWKVATFLSRLGSLPPPVRAEWQKTHPN
jgi:mono/diheme cytochrome c family protein